MSARLPPVQAFLALVRASLTSIGPNGLLYAAAACELFTSEGLRVLPGRRPRKLVAKRPGVCSWCAEPFDVGASIVWAPGCTRCLPCAEGHSSEVDHVAW